MQLTIQEYFNRLDEIKATSGRNDKITLLTNLLDEARDITVSLYRIGLDPKINTFVAKFPAPPESDADLGNWENIDPFDMVLKVVAYFHDQNVTGKRLTKKEIEKLSYIIHSLLPENGILWMKRALTKDWTLGTAISAFNKAALRSKHEIDKIFEFDTVRVSNIAEADVNPLGSYVSIKKDGVNASVIGDILSRNGNRIWLKHIEDAIPAHIKDKYKLMGELVSSDRQSSSGLCNSAIASGYDAGDDVKALQLHVFDAIELDEYHSRKFVTPFKARKELAEQLVAEINHPDIILVEHHEVNSLDEVLAMNDQAVKEFGEEGVIWNDKDMLFGIHRSTKRARIKEVLDGDFRIVGFKPHAKIPDALGAFIIETSCGQLESSVGTGMTKEQRIEFWSRRDELMDKIIKVYYNKVIKHREKKDMMTLFIPVLNQKEIIRIDKTVADALDQIEHGGKKSK